MHIIFFAHPAFLHMQSIPRFTRMLAEGMKARGHEVEVRIPRAQFARLPAPNMLRKWLGYIDQYLIFPNEIRDRLKKDPLDTLYVFTDHALGPWVPLVSHRPHVIHCHDFLAQRSALGEIAENPTSWTGRRYQAYIRQGYSQGSAFISVSQTTREDLHRFLPSTPVCSEVVYNGLNQNFAPHNGDEVRDILKTDLGFDTTMGYLLHVGGNQWYKNRQGVIELYDAWRTASSQELPLVLIGEKPNEGLINKWQLSPFREDIHWLSATSDETLRLAYAGATIFLFPSLAEGFGWPIAEAMAAGCPVITTREPPMTEVGGDAAYYIVRRPESADATAWATDGAQVIRQVLELSQAKRRSLVEAGLENARRFEAADSLSKIEKIYQNCLNKFGIE
jgi:glycosyltransferase involved in cell wall biosynthesis